MDPVTKYQAENGTENVQLTPQDQPKKDAIDPEGQRIIGGHSRGEGGDVEGQNGRGSSFKNKNILLRRSTTVFSDRLPTGGVVGLACVLCCSLLCSVVVLTLVNGISIACIVIGIIYLDKENCPGDERLAPMLIASGVLAVFFSLIEGRSRFMVAVTTDEAGGEVKVTKPKKDWFYYVVYIARMVKTVVFIFLVFVVFRLSPNVKFEPYSVGPDEVNYYCNPNLFLFAYWLIMVIVILSCVILSIFLCLCCFGIGMALYERRKQG